MVACFRPSLSWTCVIELVFLNHDKTLAVKKVIEIPSFRRSLRCATWRAVGYNIARTSCFENDDLSSPLHTLKFFAARATVKQNNTPIYRYWSRNTERMVDRETTRLFYDRGRQPAVPEPHVALSSLWCGALWLLKIMNEYLIKII